MSRTGLDYLQRVIAGELAPVAMLQTMNIRMVEAAEGFIRALVTPGDNHLVRPGVVHGGYAATVLDTLTGAAVSTVLEEGTAVGTIDLSVKLLRPIRPGIELTAQGRLINLSRRLAVSDARIEDAEGKLYALGSATNMLIRVT